MTICILVDFVWFFGFYRLYGLCDFALNFTIKFTLNFAINFVVYFVANFAINFTFFLYGLFLRFPLSM